MLRNAKLKGPIGRIYPIFIIGVTILSVGEFLVHYKSGQEERILTELKSV